MNKIYKVIWSKVKHQYVVVSELAHSSGKQSRTAKRSLRSRIAALVVCGAIAAFGVFGMPDIPSAYAADGGAETQSWQYLAIGGATTDQATDWDRHWVPSWGGGHWEYDAYYRDIEDDQGNTHRYVYTRGDDGNYYWVREGYSIDIVENQRYPSADKNTIINVYKGEGADTDGIVQSYQNVQESLNVGTLNGDILFDTNTDMYGGAVNTSTTAITSGQNYRIEQNGRYIEAGMDNFGDYFNTEDVEYNSQTGLYTFKGKDVDTENLYVIDGKVGVFTTTANGDTVYTGDVYGRNNEILMTGVDSNDNLVSYWGAEIVDPNATIGDMTISTLEGKFDEVNNNIEKIHKDDIKEIQVAPIGVSDDGNGGTIGLQTNGEFDADGNPTGGAMIPGGITVTSVANPNEDTKIKFENEKGSFTVNAGSRVEGTTGAASGETLTGLSINGVDYQLGGGKTYTDGDGISISQDDTNTISVNTGNGLKIENDQVVANVDGTTVKTNGQGQLTATTLDEDSSGITATSTYGKDYAVKDTAGNTVTIEDIASAGKLEEVDTTVKGHTTTINALDGRVTTVENNTIDGGSINDKGKISLTQQNGPGITLDGAVHDYALDDQDQTAKEGKVTLTGKDRYGDETYDVTIDGLVTTDTIAQTIKDNNNLKVEAGEKGRWTITDTSKPEGQQTFTNTTLADKVSKDGDKDKGYTYTVSDTAGNTAVIDDVASATKLTEVAGDVTAIDGRVKTVEGDMITGSSIGSDGKINLRQQDGGTITSDNAIHDYVVDNASLNEEGTLTLNTKDQYSGQAGKDITVTGIASQSYVGDQITENNKVITENYQNYFGSHDKYLSNATFDNNSGELKLTVAKAGENGAAQEYSFDLGKYVEGKDVYVNQISIDKDNNKLILNRKNATPLELGLEELSDIGVSSTDYQLVENPANGSDGKYTVDNNGNLTLTVKDLNNKNAATKTITISGLAKKTDVAVIHDQYKDGEYTNLRDTKAQIWDETSGASDKKSSSIALGKDAFVSVQNGRKADAILFGSDTYTGGIAIGQDSKALNGTVNIGVKDYTGKMGDVIVGDPNNRDLDNGEYNTYTAMGVGETSVGSNSYISGSLSTNIGSYNVITTKYMNGGNPLDSAQNFGSITVGTLNSIESNSSDSSMLDTIFGKVSGVANSVVGMANKTQNSNGSLVFGTGNEITNSIDTIPTPSSVSGDVADVAENFRDSVSDRNKSNGGAVLAIGGGNKADYAQNSQLIGVQNEITGTSRDISKFNMINGYQNTITNGSNDTVIGTKNTVTNGDSNVVLGDNHTVQNADNNVILGSSDKVATQTASNTVVIGYNAQANSNNDVAIGSGSVANGAVKTAGYAGANPIGTVSVGSEGNERTITNVAAGRINEDSTDAVNGSQLYATNQNVTNLTTKVDAGWSLYSNGKEVKNVKPGNNLVNIDSGENVSITKNEDGNGITISADLKDLDVEDTNAVLYDNEGKTSVTLGGTGHEAVKLTNVAAGALTETSTDAVNGSQLFETNTKVDAGWSLYSNGKEVKNVKPGNNLVNIDSGENVSITKNEDGNGIKISADLKDLDVEDTNAVLYDDEGKTTVTLGGEGHEAVKLTNVAAGTVNATSTDAINGSQLYEVQQQAGKHTTVTVNGGMTAPEDGSYTHDEEGRLDGNLLLKKTDNNGQTEYDLKLNPDLTLQGEDGSTARVEIGGTNGTIMATKDPNSMTATTTIDGGNVYVGSSVSVGDKVVMTNKDITGLSNTTWDGTTDDVSRAATEGQLQAVSNEAGKHTTVTVNGGMTAPEDGSYTHDEEGRLDGNLLLKKTDNNGQTEYDLKLNPDLTLQGEDGSTARVEIGGTNGTIMATKDPNSMTATTTIDGGNVYVGSSVSVGDKVEITDKDITGLSNTSWNGTTDDESRAATEGQLKDVSDTVNAGWTATDSNGASIVVNPENGSTLNFAGDRNIEVKANEKDGSIDVSLDDDMVLGGKEGTSRVEIGGTNGTIMATKDPNSMAATTTIDGGNVYVGSSISVGDKVEITDKDITGLSNTEWNGTTTTPDRAATEGQLQQVSNDVNAGWIATDNNGSQVNITPDNNKLNFAGDENVTVTAANNEIKVALKDDIVLGDYLNGDDGVLIGGSSGTISATNSITVGEDQGLIIDGQKKEIQGLSNTTWNEKIANDAAVEGSTAASTAATQGQLQEVSKVANAGWTASDGTNSISVKPNETLTFVGDENLTVSADGTDKELKVSLNDDITLKGDSSSIELTGTKGTIQVNQETAEGTNFTNINGNVVSIGYTNSEGIENAIVIDGGKGTITGLENTTWTPPAPVATFANEGTETSRAATEAQLNDLYGTVVGYNVDTNGVNYGTVTLGGGRTSYDQDTHEGGTVLNNVAYASGTDGSEAVNVDYLKDAISDAAENGSISTSDQHLVANTETGSNGVYKPNDDGNVNLIVSDEKGNSSTITIGDVASKTELDSLKTNVGDLSYSKVQGDDVKDGDSVTTAIGKLDNKIENISGTATDADNNTVTGGKINSDGTISLTQKDKDSIKLEGQLTDSGVVQEGTSFDKETGTITITSQDKYSGETSSVKVEGVASTEVVGATNKEDLATAYKDADKDGNATTEYITDSESMVEADVALDHAIQDVANTGYANDMVLSNRIDSVEKRLGNVEERIDKVGAMAAAIANLRTMGFDPEAPTEIAIGVGQYKSETGIAIGVFHYPNQDFMLSASLSSSGDELMGGIGATWKLGRKSAAERAKDEEARHLEQAEEMKKLAQQEKVKAQAQRHAKLLAERQQASQKNA